MTETIDDIVITRLRMSVRSNRTLASAGITTIGQLRRWSARDLLTIPGLGRKSLCEIREALALNKIPLRYEGSIYEVAGPPAPIPLNRRSCEILRLRAEGLTLRAIGAQYGISGARVRDIIHISERQLRSGRRFIEKSP